MLPICIVSAILLACLARSEEFDYIVVGEGTSGIPLAVRLAEYWNVALIEAGVRYEESYPLPKIPGADILPLGSRPGTSNPADWGFVTEPFPGANGRALHISRGKCLGGSSAFNFMIYQRPTKQSLDLCAEKVNDTSYQFENVLPFYQRSVEFTRQNTVARFENASVLYKGDAFVPVVSPLAETSKGPLASSASDFLAWEKIPYPLRRHFSEETLEVLSQFPVDWPEVEYISAPGFIGNVSNLKADQPDDGYHYASIIGVLIASTSHQEVVVAMFKRMREVFASEAMGPVLLGDEYLPRLQVQTDEEKLEYIREIVMTLWHPSRTCKMGTSDDPDVVVDSRCRVFEVNRPRVVDASAIPFLPPGHPQSTCYMLTEKIAHDILQNDAGLQENIRLDLRP
ncbi:hypothetical protein BJX64DRAFT_294569 [Aspergillus heterothallicus]